MEYGLTEVFIKHKYYSELRVKLIKKDGNKTVLCSYNGEQIEEVCDYATNKKLYQIPERFLQIKTPENLYYIYEKGEHSMYRYKYIKHVGSSRSSKSWSIEEAIIRQCEETPNFRVTIWRDSQTSLGETIWKDFRKLFPLSGRVYKFNRNTTPIFFDNGSMIEPHGDDTTNAHGLTQNIAWLNEPYKMSEETFHQIDMRADQIIIDINPTGSHWSDELEKNPRCKTIHSTFQDNPFCPTEMRLKILSYDPSNPINVENGTANNWKWQVYGLGLKAEKPNRIFSWKECTLEHYMSITSREYIGIDWGKVDPFGIVGVKYHDGRLFIHEYNYDSEDTIRQKLNDANLNTEHGILNHVFERLKIDKSKIMICDTNRPEKGAFLRQKGYNVIPAPNKGILEGISILQSLEVYYTNCSENIRIEVENYEWDTDRAGVLERPIDAYNHTIDPIRYVVVYQRITGVIKYL